MTSMLYQGISLSGYERNCCYLNTGSGRFANVSAISGLDLMDDARAHALVDWDHDGDLDLWTANRNAPQLRFLRNDTPQNHHYLAVRLRGRECNRDGIGARVEVVVASGKRQGASDPSSRHLTLLRTLRAGEGFLGQSSKWLHFGLGAATRIERLVVRWPGGKPEEFSAVEADGFFQLVQGTGVARRWRPPSRTGRLEASPPQLPPESRRASVLLTQRLPLPPLECRTRDGKSIVLSDRRPGPLLVNLWASWCQPCLGELKEFADHQRTLREAGLDIIALSIDALGGDQSADPQAARRLLDKLSFPFREGIASAELVDQLQILHNGTVTSQRPLPVPTSFLVDTEGRLAAMYKGTVSIERLLADVETLSLPEDALLMAALPLSGSWYTKPPPRRLARYIYQFFQQGHVETALRYLDENRKLFSNDHDYVNLLNIEASHLARREDPAKAEARYREALQVDPDSAATYLNLGMLLGEQGRHEEAVAAYRAVLQLEPTSVKAQVYIGLASGRLGKDDQAEAAFREAVRLDPDLAVAQINLGILEARKGRVDEGERRLRAAIKSNPKLSKAHLNLGELLALDGRLDEAVQAYREASRLEPDSAAAHLRLGEALARQNQLTEALHAYREVVRINPQTPSARVRVGAVLAKLGQTREALATYRETLRIDPEFTIAQNNLAWILATDPDTKNRDGEQAVYWAEAVARSTQFKRPRFLDTLAAAYAEAGRFEDAVRTVNRAIELARSSGSLELVALLESRLEVYKRGQPIRTVPSRR